MVNSLSAYLVAEELFSQTPCYGGYNLYRENRRAGEAWESFGLLPVPSLAYGRIPVMVTESCLARTLHICQKGACRGINGGEGWKAGEGAHRGINGGENWNDGTSDARFDRRGDDVKNPRKIEIKGPKGDEFVAVAHCGYCVNTIYTKYPEAVGEQRPVGAQRTSSTSCTNSMSRTDREQRSIGSQRTMDAQCSAGGCQIDFTWENAEEVREVIRKWNL